MGLLVKMHTKFKSLLLVLFVATIASAVNVDLRINEFMASNRSVLQDEDGNWDDWIEIYNANDYPLDLAGMFISDDLQNPRKSHIPYGISATTTIPAHDFLILWADDSTEQGFLHLDFALSGGGEQIVLTQGNGYEMLDSISYSDLISDAPYGRTVDGDGHFSYMLASPGSSNVQPDFAGLYINEIMASNGLTLEDGDIVVTSYNGSVRRLHRIAREHKNQRRKQFEGKTL